ncbi:MAG: hypothetical protein ACJ8C4_20555 [Gemmataceae bacterium]
MFRLSAYVVLVSILGANAICAAEIDQGRTGFQRFNSGPPISPLPPTPPEKPKPRQANEQANKASETAAALRAQEEANYLRRLLVCDRLKQIALETGNSELEAQAIRLEERASEVYKLRTANLPAGKTANTAPRGDHP